MHLRQKLELNSEHFRAMVYTDFRRGLTQQYYAGQLSSTVSDEVAHMTTVFCWYVEFNRGRRLLQDIFLEGRPIMVVLPENIDAVREMLLRDRHMTYREIEVSLDISFTSGHTFLHEHLNVRKICSHWIPNNMQIALTKVLRVE